MAIAGIVQHFLGEQKLPQLSCRLQRCGSILVCVVCLIFAYTTASGTYLMQYELSEMPQYKFAKIMEETEDATLLNYNFMDGGFYTVSGIIPDCKYFCTTFMNDPEMMKQQDETVKNGDVDYVVTCREELTSEIYDCISEAEFFFEGDDCTFYLYRNNSL
ncbi:MAG: hypothetical protein LUC60_03730 [Lachnospiraceae bacterium]|nr:hypothetical protein [Lachnospiraceae bacterium]